MFFPDIKYILILEMNHHIKLNLLIHINSNAWSDIFNWFWQKSFSDYFVLELTHQRVNEHNKTFVGFQTERHELYHYELFFPFSDFKFVFCNLQIRYHHYVII